MHLVAEATRDPEGAVFWTVHGGIELVALARVLARNSPSLVIWSGGREVAAVAPTLAAGLLETVPAMLSQCNSMPDELLELYTLELYRGLGAIQPVDTALAAACSAALFQFPSQAERMMPALYLSREDAVIFESASSGSSTDTYQISEGSLSPSLAREPQPYLAETGALFPAASAMDAPHAAARRLRARRQFSGTAEERVRAFPLLSASFVVR